MDDADSTFDFDVKGLEDFDMLLSAPVLDISGSLLEEDLPSKCSSWSGEEDDISPRNRLGARSGITTKDAVDDADKKAKRRKQIAAASRASRARRKYELEELREDNTKLRDERNSFLSKIGELQVKVESMRERGSSDMRVENALLRAQLEEHKRFVACFKHLCDGAPTTVSARHLVYKQGSDAAQSHVLGLISQSLADNWSQGRFGETDLPYQDLQFYYKYIAEYGATSQQRLNIRVDITFPGFDASTVSDFLWNSFSSMDIQQRLYGFKDIELSQLADDMPNKDTKMVYFREKWENATDKVSSQHFEFRKTKQRQDWVVICNRREKELPLSTLCSPDLCTAVFEPNGLMDYIEKPSAKRLKCEHSRVNAHVLALSTTTTEHTDVQASTANRITSMLVQGAVTWNDGGDAKLIVVFSFPDDFKLKNMHGLADVVQPDGLIGEKFADVLREFNELIGEME